MNEKVEEYAYKLFMVQAMNGFRSGVDFTSVIGELWADLLVNGYGGKEIYEVSTAAALRCGELVANVLEEFNAAKEAAECKTKDI